MERARDDQGRERETMRSEPGVNPHDGPTSRELVPTKGRRRGTVISEVHLFVGEESSGKESQVGFYRESVEIV